MSKRLREFRAYAFSCPLELDALRAKLEEIGPWTWIERDSHYFGDYVSTRAREDYAMLKVYPTGEGEFQLDIRFEAEGAAAKREWRAFDRDLRERLLPALGARDVRETDTMN